MTFVTFNPNPFPLKTHFLSVTLSVFSLSIALARLQSDSKASLYFASSLILILISSHLLWLLQPAFENMFWGSPLPVHWGVIAKSWLVVHLMYSKQRHSLSLICKAQVSCILGNCVFTSLWWRRRCSFSFVYLWAVSCPHSVVSEAVAWCKLFGQNEIIHLQRLEHSPGGNQIE